MRLSIERARARWAAAAGLLVTISLVLSACGGGSSGVSAPTSEAPSPVVSGKIGPAQISGLQGAALVRALREGGLPSEQPPAGENIVLISSALDIPQPQPAVLHDLGPGETAIFRPGPAGKATLLARIGESAWPKLLQAATIPPTSTR